MSINKKMWLLSAITAISIILVGVFSAYTLSDMRTSFLNYQSEVTTSEKFFEIKATALSVAKNDPIFPNTKMALDAANDKITVLLADIEQSLPPVVTPDESEQAQQLENEKVQTSSRQESAE